MITYSTSMVIESWDIQSLLQTELYHIISNMSYAVKTSFIKMLQLVGLWLTWAYVLSFFEARTEPIVLRVLVLLRSTCKTILYSFINIMCKVSECSREFSDGFSDGFANCKTAPTQNCWQRIKEYWSVWFYNKNWLELSWSHSVICLGPQKWFLELWNWTGLLAPPTIQSAHQTPLTLISIR